MLKPVPNHIKIDPRNPHQATNDDPRWSFFVTQGKPAEFNPDFIIYLNSSENNKNYYYRKTGDKYEPLGKFTKLVMPANQTRAIGPYGFKGYLEYYIEFDRIYDSNNNPIKVNTAVMTDELYYTDTEIDVKENNITKKTEKTKLDDAPKYQDFIKTIHDDIAPIYQDFVKTIQPTEKYTRTETSILKKVPKYNYSQHAETEERHLFFSENLNSEKYYYMTVGNTLVPLGTFIRFEELPKNMNSIRYGLMFSIPPYNSGIGVGCGENLVYTDYPPAAGSVPLTYTDYKNMVGGKKTRKHKNKKLKKTKKYKKRR